MRVDPCTALSFYVLRHGETDANAAGIIQGSSDRSRLTPTGRRQALGMGALAFDPITTKRIDQVFVSPLTRARETLTLIRQEAPPGMLPETEIILPDLREIDFYSWENQSKEDLQCTHPDAFAAWKRGDPEALVVDGKQPLLEIWDRAEQVWEQIREQCRQCPNNNDPNNNNNNHAEETAKLLVCHGTLGQALLGTAFGMDATTFRTNVFPNCGMAEIVWHPDKDLADSWNWHNSACVVEYE